MEIKELIKLLESCHSWEEAMDRIGRTKPSIHSRLKRNGYKITRRFKVERIK